MDIVILMVFVIFVVVMMGILGFGNFIFLVIGVSVGYCMVFLVIVVF